MHLVLARKVVLSVVQQVPGQADFPKQLEKSAQDRIETWFLPLYPHSRDHELGILAPDALTAAVSEAAARGMLIEEEGGAAKLAAHLQQCSPGRSLVLLAMQANRIRYRTMTLSPYRKILILSQCINSGQFCAAKAGLRR